MTSDPAALVRQFHEAFGLPVRTTPDAPDWHEEKMRYDILAEEFGEYRDAVWDDGTMSERDRLVEVADALGDIVYVAYGTALAYGIDLDAVIDEIHTSNMSKLGDNGAPIHREDGKVLKGPNYEPPNIKEVLWPNDEFATATSADE